MVTSITSYKDIISDKYINEQPNLSLDVFVFDLFNSAVREGGGLPFPVSL